MKVLVDSSVWVEHFKQRNEQLAALLADASVICHPYVVAEVACGTPPNRKTVIELLAELEAAPVATQDELLTLLDTRQLYGRGCGFVDMSLLASALLAEDLRLWTADKRLAKIAGELNKAYQPILNS